MVKDEQVKRLMRLRKTERTRAIAASKAGMDEKTARKWARSGRLPSQKTGLRWRTRVDPFAQVWGEVETILERAPTVEAKTVFDHLCRQYEGRFQSGQLRTLQRRIKAWRAVWGEAKEVIFAQRHRPGEQSQSDFTRMSKLGVTINGQPFEHMLYHFVLCYSNWESVNICSSESFESLQTGLQKAVWQLGAVPKEHRTDSLSSAVNNLNRIEEFTERYQALLRHYGLKGSHTQAGQAHENGDVEQSHYRFKKAVEQELLLRASLDFASIDEYRDFLERLVRRRNATRHQRLVTELSVMRRLPVRRLEDFTVIRARVSSQSTIRIRKNTYSVHSRLIGEWVDVRVYGDRLDVFYGGVKVESMARLRGAGKHAIDYRHVIHSLVRKPAAFQRYRYREDLFPGLLFRVAYDELRTECPSTAARQYLQILFLAASKGEQRIRQILKQIVEKGERIRAELVAEKLTETELEPWEVAIPPVEINQYDTLLGGGDR
jgi:hypothetical protein